jgi:hypothetical protein
MPAAPASNQQRVFNFRAGRALVLGVIAMAAVAWIVSVPAVLLAVTAAASVAFVTAQATRFSTAVICTLTSACAGALAGSFIFGHGPLLLRTLVALVATLAAGPWALVLGFVLRTRALQRS